MKIKQEKFENPNQSIDYHIFTRDFCEKHNHEYHEIFIVLADTVNYFINGRNLKLNKKTLSFVKRTDCHSFKGVNGSNATHINLYFSDELLKLVSNGIDINLYTKLMQESVTFSLNSQEYDYINYTVDVINNSNRNSYIYFTELKSLLYNLLNIINRNTNKLNLTYPDWFNELILQIHKPSFISSSVKDIYSACNYSEPIIINAFKKFTGVTPVKYLNELKLNYACNMLKNTNKTTLEISQDIGYESLSHFNRIFKSHFNITPKQYRNKR